MGGPGREWGTMTAAKAEDRTQPPPGYLVRDQWWSRDGVPAAFTGGPSAAILAAWAIAQRSAPARVVT